MSYRELWNEEVEAVKKKYEALGPVNIRPFRESKFDNAKIVASGAPVFTIPFERYPVLRDAQEGTVITNKNWTDTILMIIDKNEVGLVVCEYTKVIDVKK